MRRTSYVKHTGLSKSSIDHSSRRWGRQSTTLVSVKQRERRYQNEAARQAQIREMSEDNRHNIHAMDTDFNEADSLPTSADLGPCPGDEGHDISHEGGDYEVFEGLAEGVANLTGLGRADHRTRRDRVENLTEGWRVQVPRLVMAYLEYRQHEQTEGSSADQPPQPSQPSSLATFTMEVLDLFYRCPKAFVPDCGHIFPNETLVRHGYIGTSPVHTSMAISIRTLECFRQTHRTCPRFSVEAQCKTLCHLHNLPYKPYLATQFSIAYDAFLWILREVDTKVRHALGHDTLNWRFHNVCPPCFYKIDGEPDLDFSFFAAIDGNNSLWRMGDTIRNVDVRLDSRTIQSDRWLSLEEVDLFKDEVQSSKVICSVLLSLLVSLLKVLKSKDVDVHEEDDWEDVDTPSVLSKCVDRWRNAGPEQRKAMFALFEETGIFLACCRHRFALLVCDMIKSGERAKYPLALVNRLMTIYGSNIGVAYDIGCAFDTTLRASSLGPRARELNLRFMVGSFHGHAHNRLCQLAWHPLYIPGTGHSEGEGCEHIFSSSNDQARTTRHATRFHRHQSLEEHFDFWDQDKYAALGNFLYNHYREALETCRTLEVELQALQDQLGLSSTDFEEFCIQEKTYLEGLKNTPAEVTLKIQYVQGLNKLAQIRQEWDVSRAAANQAFVGVANDRIHQVLLDARRNVDATYTKLEHAEAYIYSLERQIGIEDRWAVGSDEYQQYQHEAVLADYRDALDELERLIVQRLFELSKLGLSGTGYKLRRQIGKALQRRSEAIRKALSRYNAQATKLIPPRPPLTWKEIVEYSFLAEFDLLRLSRTDIRSERWTQPSSREGTIKYLKLRRAREEIVRLNVEICRLRTAIYNESRETDGVLHSLQTTDPALGKELQRRWLLRRQVNACLLQRLDQIERLSGFTGRRGFIGVRQGCGVAPTSVHSPPGFSVVSPEDLQAEVDREHDKEVERITEYLELLNI